MGIGNFMSSHSLSASHVPLGLGRDNLNIIGIENEIHEATMYLKEEFEMKDL